MLLSQIESSKYYLETKEEIVSYSYELLTKRINKLGINQKFPFDSNKIKFLEQAYFANGKYFIEEDFIAIDIASWFNIKTIIHELIHAFSSGKRNNKTHDDYEAFSKSFILNEGTTDLIALDILEKDTNDILLGKHSEETKSRLISKMREETANEIKEIRTKGYLKIKEARANNDEFSDFFVNSHKNTMKINSSFSLSLYKHEEDRLKNEIEYESGYTDYVKLVKNILGDFSNFYKKNYEKVFIEWQQDYFNGNYNKIIKQLKEVYGDFENSFLEGIEKKSTFLELEQFFKVKK